MYLLKFSLALFASRWALGRAQQPCYWPDGSSVTQGNWVNCYSFQDSICCNDKDVCLSNGFCYGLGQDLMYRSACTVKDWSNRTACPDQECNNVQITGWANIWRCPLPYNTGAKQWWCGNENKTIPCQTGIDAHFLEPTPASILGLPPITSFASAASKTTTFSTGPTSNPPSVLASSPANTTTNSAVLTQTQRESTNQPTDSRAPIQNQEHSASTPTAIGVGIGVPLGIAAIGFLGFLFWKEGRRQRTSKSRILNREPTLENVDHSTTVGIEGSLRELPDTPLLRELDGVSRAELPSAETAEV